MSISSEPIINELDVVEAATQRGMSLLGAGEFDAAVERLGYAAELLVQREDDHALAMLAAAYEQMPEGQSRRRLLVKCAETASVLDSADAASWWRSVADTCADDAGIGCRARVHEYWAAPSRERLARLAVSDDLIAQAHGWGHRCRALAAALEDRLDEALGWDTTALQLARDADDRELEALSLRGIAYVHGYTGALDAAVRALRESIATTGVHGGARWQIETRLSLIDVLLENLQTANALREAGSLVTLLQTQGPRTRVAQAEALLAAVLAQSGDLRRALTVLSDTQAGPDGAAELQRQVVHAEMLLESGDIEAVQACDPVALVKRAIERGFRSQEFEARLLTMRARYEQGQSLASVLSAVPDAIVDEPVSMLLLSRWIARASLRDNNPETFRQALAIVAKVEVSTPLVDLMRSEIEATGAALALTSGADEMLWAVADEYELHGRGLDAVRCRVSAAIAMHPEEPLAGEPATDQPLPLDRLLALQRQIVERGALLDLQVATGRLRVFAEGSPALTASTIPGIFDGLSFADVYAVQSAWTERELEAGDSVLADDPENPPLCIVQTGIIQIIRSMPGDKQLVVARLYPGDTFGMGGLAGGHPEETSVAACTSKVACIDHVTATRLLRSIPTLGTNLVHQLSGQVSGASGLAGRIAYLSTDQHLAQLLLELATRHGHPTLDRRTIIDVVISQHELASMIGASRNSVAAGIVKLKAAGALDSRGRRLVVDVPRLRSMADPFGQA